MPLPRIGRLLDALSGARRTRVHEGDPERPDRLPRPWAGDAPADADANNDTAPPNAYGQWHTMLADAPSAPTAGFCSLLAAGTVDTDNAMPVLELIRRYCERSLNAETHRLARLLDQNAADADGIAVACVRYAHVCERLLFFTDIRGLAALPQTSRLADQMRAHVASTLRHVGEGCNPPNDDVAYCTARLARHLRGPRPRPSGTDGMGARAARG